VGGVNHIHWTSERPTLTEPILIVAFEGWGDAGDASTTALRHIQDRAFSTPFAEIAPEEFFDFTTSRPMIRIEGSDRLIEWPNNTFSSVKVDEGRHDLITMVGEEPQLRWKEFTQQIIHIVESFDVKLVVSLGALIADVVHSRPAMVYSSGYDPELIERLDLEPSTYEGPTGIIGVLHDELRQLDVASMSLWAAVPGYVPNATSPKAALALVKRVNQLLELTIPTTALELATVAYEKQITDLVSESDETQAYVEQLEETYDSMSPTSSTALIEELEQYLKDR